jgi:hypothetical protein
MKSALCFLAGLSIFPLAALVLWLLMRHEERPEAIVPELDPDTLARARAAQAMAEDHMCEFRFSLS